MPKINLSNITLNYEDKGKGKVLLFLHGLGSSIKDWDFQVPFFSKNFRVITVDLRGHGDSTMKDSNFGVDHMVNDIKEFLDALKIDKVTFIGFSMGGAIAFQFTYSYPEKIDKMVIVNSGPDFNNMGKIGEDLLKNRTEFLKTNGLDPLAKEIAFNMFPESHQLNLRNEFEARCKKNDFNSYYQSFVTLMDWGMGDKIKDIKAKTLVIASDIDYTPIAFKEEYVKKLQNASLVVIKNSRHGVVLDQPEAFNKALFTFLSHE
ncbi:alpha/beta hydrolase [Aureibaculum sp. A20]|uniref:Alpha/beta hydrolase n=1 Tax=Aureibaculum flavum TaxID=2795986 RepID=A0ABS0WQB3_9FLAO|nr:alpha/beta hydrolase [Aureibaculum flavum]MBJ2174166.1 alpha/beta hydrolase [Aureibaculum flavum]